MASATMYVDESGDFAEDDCVVAIAGLVVRSDVAGLGPAELEAALRNVAPTLPWPLHAAVYNYPLALGLSAWARRSDRRATRTVDLELIRLGGEALEALEAPRVDGIADTVAAFDAGREPAPATVRALDRALRRRAPGLHRELSVFARRVAAAVRDVVRAAVDEGGPGAVLVVAASESVRGDATPHDGGPPPAPPAGDRYLALLRTLTGRAAALLALTAAAGETVALRVKVLGRHVADPVLGRPTPLHVRHLAPLARDVMAVWPQVRVVFDTVSRYEPGVHPLLVVADFTANRTRWHLGERSAPLADVERRVASCTGGPVRAPEQGVSHLAASGAAWRLVAGEAVAPRELEAARRWAREQAIEWAGRTGGVA